MSFESIFRVAKPNLPSTVVNRIEKGAKGGGALMVVEDKRWTCRRRGITIHLEFTASNRIALHVETYPYQNPHPNALVEKNDLLLKVCADFQKFEFGGFELQAMRVDYAKHHCSTVGSVGFDPGDLRSAANLLLELYDAVDPLVSPYFPGRRSG